MSLQPSARASQSSPLDPCTAPAAATGHCTTLGTSHGNGDQADVLLESGLVCAREVRGCPPRFCSRIKVSKCIVGNYYNIDRYHTIYQLRIFTPNSVNVVSTCNYV